MAGPSRDAIFQTDGPDALRGLSRAFKDAEDGKELRKQLVRRLRDAGKPTAAALQAATVAHLPTRGGVARTFTRPKYSIRNRLTGENASVRITSSKKHSWRGLEEKGELRHPVFPGGRPRVEWVWASQHVPTQGVQAVELADHIDEFRDGVMAAINDAAAALTRSIEKDT